MTSPICRDSRIQPPQDAATLDAIAKLDNAAKVLGWRRDRTGPRCLAAHAHRRTDDRHVHMRMTGGSPRGGDVRRFASSTPDEISPARRDSPLFDNPA